MSNTKFQYQDEVLWKGQAAVIVKTFWKNLDSPKYTIRLVDEDRLVPNIPEANLVPAGPRPPKGPSILDHERRIANLEELVAKLQGIDEPCFERLLGSAEGSVREILDTLEGNERVTGASYTAKRYLVLQVLDGIACLRNGLLNGAQNLRVDPATVHFDTKVMDNANGTYSVEREYIREPGVFEVGDTVRIKGDNVMMRVWKVEVPIKRDDPVILHIATDGAPPMLSALRNKKVLTADSVCLVRRALLEHERPTPKFMRDAVVVTKTGKKGVVESWQWDAYLGQWLYHMRKWNYANSFFGAAEYQIHGTVLSHA